MKDYTVGSGRPKIDVEVRTEFDTVNLRDAKWFVGEVPEGTKEVHKDLTDPRRRTVSGSIDVTCTRNITIQIDG